MSGCWAGWFSGSHFLSGLGLLQGIGSNTRDSLGGWAGSIIAILPCRSDLIAFGVVVLVSQPRLPATGWSNKIIYSLFRVGELWFRAYPLFFVQCLQQESSVLRWIRLEERGWSKCTAPIIWQGKQLLTYLLRWKMKTLGSCWEMCQGYNSRVGREC